MAYELSLRLPSDWTQARDTYEDEFGTSVTHLEATSGSSCIEIHFGAMPEDSSAEDQAFSNYVDMVGFDDEEDFNPISRIKFRGKSAFGFEALCEDEKVMALLTQEIKTGLLVVICVTAPDDEAVQQLLALVERGLRVS